MARNIRLLALLLASLTLSYSQMITGGIFPGATGATGSTSAPFVVTTNGGTDVICGLHADVITGLTCNNAVTDGTTATAFSSSVTIPANTLSSTAVPVNLSFGQISSSSATTVVLTIKLGSTAVYTSASITQSNSLNSAVNFTCSIVAGAAASSTTPIITTCTGVNFSAPTLRNTLISTSAKSIAVDTTGSLALTVVVTYSANTAGNAIWLYSISPEGVGAVGATGATGSVANPSTATNCSSSASPAVCASAAAGSVVVAAAATSVVVNTTAVTANSQIFVFYDSGLGTKLSVTCNATEPALYGVTARTAATSFTITATAPVTNPACFSYLVVN